MLKTEQISELQFGALIIYRHNPTYTTQILNSTVIDSLYPTLHTFQTLVTVNAELNIMRIICQRLKLNNLKLEHNFMLNKTKLLHANWSMLGNKLFT